MERATAPSTRRELNRVKRPIGWDGRRSSMKRPKRVAWTIELEDKLIHCRSTGNAVFGERCRKAWGDTMLALFLLFGTTMRRESRVRCWGRQHETREWAFDTYPDGRTHRAVHKPSLRSIQWSEERPGMLAARFFQSKLYSLMKLAMQVRTLFYEETAPGCFTRKPNYATILSRAERLDSDSSASPPLSSTSSSNDNSHKNKHRTGAAGTLTAQQPEHQQQEGTEVRFPRVEGFLSIHTRRFWFVRRWEQRWFCTSGSRGRYLCYTRREPAKPGVVPPRMLDGELDLAHLVRVTVRRAATDRRSAYFRLTFATVAEPVRLRARGEAAVEQWRRFFADCMARIRGQPPERAVHDVVAIATAGAAAPVP